MKLKKYYFFALFLVMIVGHSFSQTPVIDSLLLHIKKCSADTGKVTSLIVLSREYETAASYETALKKAREALQLAEQLKFEKGVADSYGIIGVLQYDQGNYPEALRNYFNALKLCEKNLAKTDPVRNPLAVAIFKKGISASYINIGTVYKDQENYPEALKYYSLALNLAKEAGNKRYLSMLFNNIGTVYYYKGNYADALLNYMSSLEIKKEIGDKDGMSASYINIGSIYDEQKNYKDALVNYLKALKLDEESGDKANIASSILNIGNLYSKKGEYAEAGKYLERALQISKEIGYKEYIKASFSGLHELSRATGNYRSAYENYRSYIIYRDSLVNEENTNKTMQLQMTYDFEKKEAATQAVHDKEIAIAETDKKKQRFFLLLVAAIALAVALIAVIVFRSLRITRRQKKVIEEQRNEVLRQKDLVEKQKLEVEEQKLLVDEQQRAIIDSITYAQRIQQSLMPTEKYIQRTLSRLKKNK